MGVDPQAQKVIDMIAAAGMKPFREQDLVATRAAAAAALQPSAEQVDQVEDRTVPGLDGPVPIRIYRPSGGGPLPIVVYFHGGGFVVGDLDTQDDLCRVVANRSGCLVVSVAYRLAPEHKFPAAAEDAYAATSWVAQHGEELGGDPTKLAVMGDSAGGNLSAAVALMARDRHGPPINLQVLVYPAVHAAFDGASMRDCAKDYFLTADDIEFFWEQYLVPADQANPYAVPLMAESLAGVAPAVVLTAEFDPLRDEGEAYGARLAEAGVPVQVTRSPGMIHGFLSFRALIDQADVAINDLAAALREMAPPSTR